MSFYNIVSVFIIYLASFQIAFGPSILEAKKARNIASAVEFSNAELLSKMKDFKERIAGFEKQGEGCESGPNPDEDTPVHANPGDTQPASSVEQADNLVRLGDNTQKKWDAILENMKVNACGKYAYSFDPEAPKEEITPCKMEKTPGLIEKISKKILKAEEDGNEDKVRSFSKEDVLIQSLLSEASAYRNEVQRLLKDSNLELVKKQNLLLAYLGDIALQFRDLIVVKRSYGNKKEFSGKELYNSLLGENLIFPTAILPPGSIARIKTMIGPNPSTEPFSLDVLDDGSGSSIVAYNHETLKRDILTLMKGATSKNYIRALKWMTLQMMLNQISSYKIVLGDDSGVEVPRKLPKPF